MSPEELVYLGFLAVSVPLGFLFRYLSPPGKQGAALLLGLSVTVATCKVHALHSLLTATGTWVIIRSSWRHAPALSLSWTFLYLLFFRLVTWFGLPQPTPFANAIQLLLTLKMVSLANEVHSFHLERQQEVMKQEVGQQEVMKEEVKQQEVVSSRKVGVLSREPSLYDMLSYSYCYIGILTGPFFRFQTFVDWLDQPRPLALPGSAPCLQRLRLVPVYGALFLAVNAVFPLDYVRSDLFLQHNFFFRFFYMVAVFFVFRMRFYAAWCGAEAGCISAGLGCYPERAESRPGGGPSVAYSPAASSEERYDFRTVQNIDCYNTDFCVKVRHGLRYWNMTVQWWLHHYIYPNAPFSSYTLRAGWTMLISAYWHGLHPGYYLSFLTIPLCMAAESRMEAAVRRRLGPLGQRNFDRLHWFLKMRCYDYMCMGFVLLSAADTLRYWSSVYYCIHIMAAAAILLPAALAGGGGGAARRSREGEEQGGGAGGAGGAGSREEERKSQ